MIGKRPKTGGRKKGSHNKLGQPIRDLLSKFVAEKLNELPRIWEELEPKEKVECISKMLPYTVSKLESLSLTNDSNTDIKISIKKPT